MIGTEIRTENKRITDRAACKKVVLFDILSFLLYIKIQGKISKYTDFLNRTGGSMEERRHHQFIFQLKSKIIVIFVVCVIIPSIFFLGFFVKSYFSYALKSIIAEKQNIMKETHKNIELQFSSFKDTSMSLYYNEAAKNYINREDYSKEDQYISQLLSSIVNSEKYIVSAVLDLDGTIYNSGYHYLNWEEYLDEHLDQVLDKKGKVVWIPTEQMSASYNQRPKNFALARAINSANQNVGTLWLFFSEDLFTNILKNPIYHEAGTDYYIVSQNRHIVTSNYEEETGMVQNGELFTKALTQQNGSFSYHDPDTGKEKTVVCSSSEVNDWVLLTVTDQSVIFKDVNYIKWMAAVTACLYAVFLFTAYYILSHYIFKPMQNLSAGLRRVSERDFRRIEENPSADEMGMLTANFNYMVDEIQCLIQDIREEEKAKNEEKIKVLSMQIGPHFIYNTLNTIKWMAAANKQTNIKKMIESLIKLMVSVTYNTNEEITLGQEVELLGCYVYIQKMRFMNFDFEYDLPGELRDLKILKLLLQPFVENCIQYAFGDKPDGGRILMEFYKEDALYVKITDNGKGFDTSVLADCDAKDTSKGMDHVGIVNVMERIRLNYGESYRVSITSCENEGTEVLLRLPVIDGEEGVNFD